MLTGGLHVPWRDETRGARFEVAPFIDLLERQNPRIGTTEHDLLTALRHARSRVQEDPWGSPEYVRYAQAVLEIAVEWSMPAVERWAVAWLMAAGGSHLRLRWSSRSRDGKVRRDARSASPVTALASGPGKVMIGTASGEVRTWTDAAGLSQPLRRDRSDKAVWALAARDDRVLVGGANGLFLTEPEAWPVPRLGENRPVGGITATAISPAGFVACGDNEGRVWICPPDGDWIDFPGPDDSTVLALSFRGNDTIQAVWQGGWTAESGAPHTGDWMMPGPRKLQTAHSSAPISAAAFDETGERLAIAIAAAGEVSVFHLPTAESPLTWDHPGARDVAWSPAGLLASSGEKTLLVGEPGRTDPVPIRDESAGGLVAFLGADHIVTAKGPAVVQWAVREAGSDVPNAEGEDEITAIAVDPWDRGHVIAGTRRGHLLRYDSRGSASTLLAGNDIRGPVNQIVRRGDEWLIAAQTGPYRWRFPPGNAPRPLGNPSRMCRAVAALGQDGAYAANNQVFTLSGAPPLTFATAVYDICLAPGGSVAAIDASGTIVARDQAGTAWRVPGLPARAGWRLLDFDGQSARIWNPNIRPPVQPDGEILAVSRYRQYRKIGVVPADAKAVCAFDSRRVAVVCPERGVGGVGLVTTDSEQAITAPIVGVATHARVLGADGHRIVAASGERIVGYEVLEPAAGDREGALTLKAAVTDDGTCSVTLPDGAVLELATEQFAQLRDTRDDNFQRLAELARHNELPPGRFRELAAGAALDEQSRLVAAGKTFGDQIWQAGLALAMDRARGDDPDRPVRIEWQCDDQADEIPWELVHPSAAPLGWFDDPPVTVVRSIEPDHGRPDGRASASEPLARHTVLVIRGTEIELGSSDEAYARTQRRTRRSNVSFLSRRPVIIEEQDDLGRVLPGSVDILQVWAHCGPREVRFSSRAAFPIAELADAVARCGPRLAVLVGCRSGALGRALVRRGVEGVVAMRVEVYSRTIQPLVEDLVSLALTGTPIDLAFAEALRSYVLTGQPGAAAVPLLYLAAGSSGTLFPTTVQAASALPERWGKLSWHK